MGFLLLFDITNEQSFVSIRNWLDQLKVCILYLSTYLLHLFMHALVLHRHTPIVMTQMSFCAATKPTLTRKGLSARKGPGKLPGDMGNYNIFHTLSRFVADDGGPFFVFVLYNNNNKHAVKIMSVSKG